MVKVWTLRESEFHLSGDQKWNFSCRIPLSVCFFLCTTGNLCQTHILDMKLIRKIRSTRRKNDASPLLASCLMWVHPKCFGRRQKDGLVIIFAFAFYSVMPFASEPTRLCLQVSTPWLPIGHNISQEGSVGSCGLYCIKSSWSTSGLSVQNT